ncbi:RagB/SusD family nutrient uptake outer membrane protein [Belliella sp. DSM 107340]|uniref:RagB/SusD family nutrient uptake outer membrane protein n=2 Tax=Belliella calami TaxID=2923436 RepID=A0ABS9UJW7_9BACT|nr:RagB/SusD family nutrient uptake outer membrane protein [Belliella calami]
MIMLTIILIACDDFIDRSPLDQLNQETFFTDVATTQTAVIGAYRTLTSSSLYGQAFIVIPEFAAGHMRHISNFPEYVEYQNFNIRIDNPWALNIWTASYETINSCNNIIAYAPNINEYSMNENLQNMVKEAHFIRALTYFNLVRAWGDVPLITNPTTPQTTSAEIRVPRDAASSVCNQIVADLEFASDLPNNNAGSKGRANGMSVKSLLAKVHLYMGNMQEAADLASQVLQSGEFTLLENYSDIWTVENSAESIFELQFDEQVPNTFVQNANPASRQEFFASDAASLLFDEEDARREFTIREAEDNSGNINLYVGKYRTFNPPTQNVPIIRLAEVYLIYAEAVSFSNLQEGITALAAIRTRAGLATDFTGSQDDLIALIQQERRKELMFEFETWFDHCRTGAADDILEVPNSDRYLFPIPQLELDLNENLTQNPGY